MTLRIRVLLALAAVAAACGLAATVIGRPGAASAAARDTTTSLTTTATTTAGAPATALPEIRHVFVLVLENEGAASTFPTSGPAPAPYLADTMRSEGAFLPDYFGTGHASNDNYISMISGQAPNPLNSSDCVMFGDFPASANTGAPYEQQLGAGCVYPTAIRTVANQLSAAGLTWRDYNADMGNIPTREARTCGHPAIGSEDMTQSAVSGDAYATRHNPFVYFHSIIDDKASCDAHVVNLDQLAGDLSSAASTPNYVFITPNLCQDGHDATCATPGEPGGYAGINAFLSKWVPKITSSPAFRDENGLLITTFDEAPTSDTSSCCGELPGPNDPLPGITGMGGGRMGAVLLSPCIAPGTVSDVQYNHYSMLGSVEDLFGLKHLGYANLSGESYFGPDVYTRPSCADAATAPAGGTGPDAGTSVSASGSAPAVNLVARRPSLSRTGAGATVALRFASASRGARYALQVRQVRGVTAGAWTALVTASATRAYRFTGAAGATYQFRARATDPSGATSPWALTEVTIPTVAHPAGVSLSGRWGRTAVPGGLRGAGLGAGPGASYRFGYTGRGLAILGLRDPRGGLVRVSFDGVSRTISVHAARRLAETALFIHAATVGRHRLVVRVLSGRFVLEGLRVRDLA